MKVGELRQSSEGGRIQRCEVIVREVQIEKLLHPLEGTPFYFMDFTELQVKGDNLAEAWKHLRRKVVEVVTAEVQELCLGGEATWDFGVTLTFTCGMLSFNLRRKAIRNQRKRDLLMLVKQLLLFAWFKIVNNFMII